MMSSSFAPSKFGRRSLTFNGTRKQAVGGVDESGDDHVDKHGAEVVREGHTGGEKRNDGARGRVDVRDPRKDRRHAISV